uniref:Uncharacterized protein n=1 Tax=Romanomermis culicivorax TaxID=13658 RepID=A0A915JDF8_ROMCU
MAGQPSSTTGWTAQPKVTMTKSWAIHTTLAKPRAPPQQTPPSHHFDSHHSHHESHHGDDPHPKASDHSPCQDATARDSHQQDCHTDAPLH